MHNLIVLLRNMINTFILIVVIHTQKNWIATCELYFLQGCHETWKVREFGFTWKVREKSGKFVRSQGKYESSKSQGKVRDFYSELRKCGDYYVANCESTIWITWNVINCCHLIEKNKLDKI